MPFQCDAFDQQIGRTNAILTEHEAKHVKARLPAIMHWIRRIDNHLKNGKDRISNLTEILEDRSAVVTLIRRYRVALAPYKRLPTEILQHIFQYVCAGHNLAAPRAVDPPLLLCRICSSWRKIAVGMPELWTSLHFYTEKDFTPLQKLHATQTFFSRAGNLPLSLTLSDTDASPTIDFIREVIIPFSLNFQYLHLVLRPPQIKELLSLPTGSLDAVEELHVVLHMGVSPVSILPAWKPLITVFGPSSQLRRFRIMLTPFVVPQIFHLPWHRLETFRCDSSLQSEDCHELLLSCQALSKLHVRVFGVKYSGIPRVQIPLPNLTHLSVQLCDEESYDLFFLPLILPALRSLIIYHYDGLPWSSGMYNGLVERSGCRIEELYLGTLDAEAQDVIQLLECTPTLRSITLSHNTLVSPELFWKIGKCDIGACLERLFLKGNRPLDALLTMLEMRQEKFATIMRSDGRWLSASPFKFLETHVNPEEAIAHEVRIQNLREVGIEISLVQTEEKYFHL